ncbi:hypothetical protein PGIGA_G00208400 [Pangasianodon gigas]|uniref:Uncharacterized protein n=1 Tax=Pangasianodon gigas TaxID=30993 RepID=A0ACC5WG42_PANGG|nr:hypothetical protein [Pangasianodon gigas]
MRSLQMSKKKRSSQRGTAGTAGTAGACTQDSTSDQRLKCFRDIMDVVLHLSDEEWMAVTRDMTKKVTKLEFAALCTKIVMSAASSAIRRLLTPLMESFGIDSILQANDKLKKMPESKWRKWSDSDTSAQRSPMETSDFICQLVQRVVTQTTAAMLKAIRRVASGRRTICSASASSPAEDQISQPDLSIACTNEICDKILALCYSGDFDSPGGEKTSGTLLKSHQEVQGIMKGLEEVVSTSRSPFELTLKSSTPDSVPVMTKVMAPDCSERLFSDQFLSKATQVVRKVLLKTEEKIAAVMSSQTSVPVRTTRALVRSGADVGMSRRSGVQSVFQFIPKVFSGVEVRALCRTLEFFHSNLNTPCLHGARFVHRGIVMLEQVWASVKGNFTAYKDILDNCVLPTLWQQFGEEAHMGVMVRGAQTFG